MRSLQPIDHKSYSPLYEPADIAVPIMYDGLCIELWIVCITLTESAGNAATGGGLPGPLAAERQRIRGAMQTPALHTIIVRRAVDKLLGIRHSARGAGAVAH